MDLRSLMKQEVKVVGGGVVYRGKLIEATDQAVLLKTQNGFVSIALDRISQVTGALEESEEDLAKNRFVSKSFYEFDDSE